MAFLKLSLTLRTNVFKPRLLNTVLILPLFPTFVLIYTRFLGLIFFLATGVNSLLYHVATFLFLLLELDAPFLLFEFEFELFERLVFGGLETSPRLRFSRCILSLRCRASVSFWVLIRRSRSAREIGIDTYKYLTLKILYIVITSYKIF